MKRNYLNVISIIPPLPLKYVIIPTSRSAVHGSYHLLNTSHLNAILDNYMKYNN